MTILSMSPHALVRAAASVLAIAAASAALIFGSFSSDRLLPPDGLIAVPSTIWSRKP